MGDFYEAYYLRKSGTVMFLGRKNQTSNDTVLVTIVGPYGHIRGELKFLGKQCCEIEEEMLYCRGDC